jgi:hypothetical protein
VPRVEKRDRPRVFRDAGNDVVVRTVAAEVKGLEVGTAGQALARFRTLLTAELEVQPRDRVERITDLVRRWVGEDPEDRSEGRKPDDDRSGLVDRDLPFAGRKDEADAVGAGLDCPCRVVVRRAAADLDAGQGVTVSTGLGALIARINSAGSSAFIKRSPIRKPRAPAATRACVSSAE